MTTTELIERLYKLRYNINVYDYPITACEDLDEACNRLKRYEKALCDIRNHQEMCMKGEFGMSATWAIANRALESESC